MKIGILSDSHDRADAMRRGIAFLQEQGAMHYLHCGDIGDTDMLDLLAGLPAGFVWGNNDWDRRSLQRYASDLDITCFGDFGEIELDGKLFFITHGDDPKRVRRVLDEQRCDYLLLGHSHVPQDERVGKVRIINPGALHRAKPKTVALLDTRTDQLQLLPLDNT